VVRIGDERKTGRAGCLFTALAASLDHILWRDANAFRREEYVGAKAALDALSDPSALRSFICDMLLEKYGNVPDLLLGNLSPREYIQVCFVEGEGEVRSYNTAITPHTKVTTLEEYVRAMRAPTSVGDNLCVAVFRQVFELWCIVLRVVDAHEPTADFLLSVQSSLGPALERQYPARQRDGVHRATLDSRDIDWMPRKSSSRMPVFLVKNSDKLDGEDDFYWAHAASDLWNDEAPSDLCSARVLPPGLPCFDETLNPLRNDTRPDRCEVVPVSTDDEIPRPRPHTCIMEAHLQRRRRAQVVAHIIEEFDLTDRQATSVIEAYEGNGFKKANMESLPSLRRIIVNISHGRDPLARGADTEQSSETRDLKLGKRAARNAAARASTAPALRAPSPACSDPLRPADALMDDWNQQLQLYASSFSICANISQVVARETLRHYLQRQLALGPLQEGSLHAALQQAMADRQVQMSTTSAAAQPQSSVHSLMADRQQAATIPSDGIAIPPPPSRNSVHAPQNVVSESAAEFIRRWLGDDQRAMSLTEVAFYSKNNRQALYSEVAHTPIPLCFKFFWQCYSVAEARDHGGLRHGALARQIYKSACEDLHAMACRKATAASGSGAVNADLYPEAALASASSAPAPASLQAHLAQIQHTIAPVTAAAVAMPSQPSAHTMADAPPPAFISPPRPAALFQTPQHNVRATPPHQERPDLHMHSSPSVRLAADRETRAAAAKSAATTLIIMPNPSAKIMQWKAGEEKDGKGFYWSTKLAVQQAWEQHNLIEEPQNYKSFRSTIHVTMIPIICFELRITRPAFDIISDAELMERLDSKLKPTGPAEYLIKLRQIKFNHDEKTDTLLHRYRAFAEPFLQLVAESRDAGCQINDESIKLAFKAACRNNELLMMFLQEDRWTDAEAAHHRIMTQLRSFNSLQTLNSMNVNIHAQPQAQQAAAAPAAHPMPTSMPAPANPPAQFQVAPPPPPAHPQPPRHHFPPPPRHQTAMVNVMNQLMDRIDRLDRTQSHSVAPIPAPSQHYAAPAPPAPAVQVNYGQALPHNTGGAAAASPYRNPRVHDLTPHPGVDGRGQYWHPSGQLFECRFNPCTAIFCQGCGRHGHTSAECSRRLLPGFNSSGYFAERYPGQGALFAQGAAQRMTSPGQPQFIPAAPHTPQTPPPFPTPHRINPPSGAAGPSPSPAPRYTPVVRNNAAQTAPPNTQSSEALEQPSA
jgi:hypothetical protein